MTCPIKSRISASTNTTWARYRNGFTSHLAIIALGPGTDKAPIQDPTVETWGLAWDWRGIVLDRLFEIHDKAKYGWAQYSAENFGNYPEKFITLDNYPLAEVDEFLGRVGFGSSVSYMLALALWLGIKDISMWGVHAAEEYTYQRDNLLYILGIAHAIGCKVQLGDSKLAMPRRLYGIDFNGDEFHGKRPDRDYGQGFGVL